MKTLSIRDIIGPVMIGPSSSHTAGALRIALMARKLLAAEPARVTFTLYGSFAHTFRGHGTDRALVAGMLGLPPEDERIRSSFELAAEAGLEFSFLPDAETKTAHPNTVDLLVTDRLGAQTRVRGESVGGGAAVICEIDGVEVRLSGEYHSIVVKQKDECGVLAHIAACLNTFGINIATTRLFRERRGDTAYTIMETDEEIPASIAQAIEAHESIYSVTVVRSEREDAGEADPVGSEAAFVAETACDAVGSEAALVAGPSHFAAVGKTADGKAPGSGGSCAVGSSRFTDTRHRTSSSELSRFAAELDEANALTLFEELDFPSGDALLSYCETEGVGISEAMLRREAAYLASCGLPVCTGERHLGKALEVMRASAMFPLSKPQPSMGGLIGGEASKLSALEKSASLCDPLLARSCTYAAAVLETNASMGRIVAAPTAGSAGVLPALLFACQDVHGFSDKELERALANAAAIGCLIARNATVSGAEGGCQAEVGAASAMAASAAVELMGGTPAQCLDAAANALAGLLGLVCDPIAGLVEAPCQKRNATGVANALVSAQMALADIGNVVSFDETVGAMYAVGRVLPFELRESALGGLAATPSAKACARCAGC